jgi:thymidylate synthase ThyX
MKLIYEPKVFLVGRQTVDQAELDRFLRDHGVSWQSDTEDYGDFIPEVAGRLCYMSFDNPRPGGNKAYLDRIKESGHGSVLEHANWSFIFTGVSRSLTHELVRHRAGFGFCLDGDTEIYFDRQCNGKRQGPRRRTIRGLYQRSKTPHGRSRLSLMYIRCLDGDTFVRAKIKAVVKAGLKKLYEITLADGKNIRCSKDHRFLTTDGWRPLHMIGAGAVLATNGLPSTNLSEDWLKQKYQIQNLMIAEIAELAGCSAATVGKWLGRYGLAKGMGQGMSGRRPWNKGRKYKAGWKHTAKTKALLSHQKQGQNNPAWKGHQATIQAGRLRANKLYPTEVCESCGVNPGHRHHKDRNTLNNVRGNIEFLCPPCHNKRHLEEDGPSNILKVKWIEVRTIKYIGQSMTYDLEVDHPAHNFVANGFVTHNSQLSQRYVDESVAEFVVPFDLQDEVRAAEEVLKEGYTSASAALMKTIGRPAQATTGLNWIEGVEIATEKYKSLVDYLAARISSQEGDFTEKGHETHKTEVRKRARQTARSLLPNATETKIFVTANARAWRNAIEQRCSRHADTEIRVLFGEVWEVLVQEAPNLFSDYQKVSLPNGTFELVTPYRKV